MPKSSDPQRTALYRAEHRMDAWLDRGDTVRVFGSTWLPEPEVKFADVASIQHYADRVLAHIGHTDPIAVRERRGATAAHYDHTTATMAFPPRRIGGAFALRETFALHEITHHLTRHDPGHGETFARAHVDLHERIGYPVRARLLAIAYAEERVKPFG